MLVFVVLVGMLHYVATKNTARLLNNRGCAVWLKTSDTFPLELTVSENSTTGFSLILTGRLCRRAVSVMPLVGCNSSMCYDDVWRAVIDCDSNGTQGNGCVFFQCWTSNDGKVEMMNRSRFCLKVSSKLYLYLCMYISGAITRVICFFLSMWNISIQDVRMWGHQINGVTTIQQTTVLFPCGPKLQ